jgi:hypothetical protein
MELDSVGKETFCFQKLKFYVCQKRRKKFLNKRLPSVFTIFLETLDWKSLFTSLNDAQNVLCKYDLNESWP